MKKRVLITGANGFVGKNLIMGLAGSDWDIIPIVHRSTGLKNEIIANFSDPVLFLKILDSLPAAQAVVHLGAKIGWDGSSKSELYAANVLATGILAEWARKKGSYLVFASAAIVCGVKNVRIAPESKPDPDTDYGYSKWLAEELIKMSDVRHAILRIGDVFGKDGPHHLGLNKSIDNAFKGITPIVYGGGKGRRNYIYVRELAKLIELCLINAIEGTHLVAGSYTNTINEMLSSVCKKVLSGMSPERLDGNIGNDQIIERSPVFPAGISFEDAIDDMIKKYKKQITI